MAGKISEMSDASALDGSEQLETVQGGVNKKITVNDLLPVQLQEDKEIDLNGLSLSLLNGNIKTNGDIIFNDDGSSTQRNLKVADQTADGLAGNNLLIQGAAGLNNDAGDVKIFGGDSISDTSGGRGGGILIKGGIGREATQAGGSVTLRGGEGKADPNTGSSNGGDILIQSGFSEDGGNGGNILFVMGEGNENGIIKMNGAATFTGTLADAISANKSVVNGLIMD